MQYSFKIKFGAQNVGIWDPNSPGKGFDLLSLLVIGAILLFLEFHRGFV